MTHFSASSIDAPSSIVSPSTLNSLPSVFSPTGTWIPAPVAVTSISLWSPSLAESIRQRTSLFPRCWATSIMHFFPLLSTCSASLIKGRSPSSNTTSTTGPMTCMILPLFIIITVLTFSEKGSDPSQKGSDPFQEHFRNIHEYSYYFCCALAPLHTSVISWVIAACLALLYIIDKSCIRLWALSVADF